MDHNTISDIMSQHEIDSQWSQCHIINHKDVKVDLAEAVGPNATTPSNAPEQPNNFPEGCKYRLDPNKFKGMKDAHKLKDLVQSICSSCKMTIGKKQRYEPMTQGYVWDFRCSKHAVSRSKNIFNKGKWTAEDIHFPLNKGKRSNIDKSAYGRLSHSKMKYVPAAKRIADRRAPRTRYLKTTNSESTSEPGRRSMGGRTETKASRCFAVTRFWMSDKTGHYYLRTSSNFTHSFHSKLQEDRKPLQHTELDDNMNEYMTLMFNHGVSNQKVAAIMNEVANKRGKRGTLRTQTIKNLNQKSQKAIDLIQGISSDMSIAEKTLRRLDE